MSEEMKKKKKMTKEEKEQLKQLKKSAKPGKLAKRDAITVVQWILQKTARSNFGRAYFFLF